MYISPRTDAPPMPKPRSQKDIPLLRSCERCRRRKQRCDGDQPTCGRCRTHSTECSYRESGRFRKRYPREPPQQDAAKDTAILFSVPELTPALEPSPDNAVLHTPTDKAINPVEVLRTRALPDLAGGLPEAIMQQMVALIGSIDEPKELPPNLALLDPRNSATNSSRYTGAAWPPKPEEAVPQCLASLATRHALPEPPADLLAMLRAAFVDSGMKIRTRQFWATLEAGSASDFALLAHLAIAAREAQLSSPASGNSIESLCFEAARREWARGVDATTGAVYGLLLLSEYGYQTGRNGVLWEFAHNALATARRIRLRGTACPWHGARLAPCDIEYEHLLACYWSAWARVFTAAQAMSRRVDVDKELPEVPLHDMCHYTAEPVATEPTGAVTFPPTQCRHRPHCSYSAATWRCSLMASEMHNHYIDLLEHRCSPESYFDALLKWDQRMVRWRGEWPPEWDAQMDEILAVARRSGHEPVLAWPRVSTRPIDPSVYGSQRPAVAGVREVGSHLFHESQMTAADTWLMVLTAMYETGRLRAHRIALSLLHHDEGPQLVVLNAAQEGGTAAFGKCGAQGLDSFLRSSAKQGDGAFWRESAAGDPMRDAMIYHHSQFECLDAARNLQNLFTIARMLRTPLSRMGIWVVFVLEHLVSMHIDRIRGTEDVATKMDAVQRLAVTMRHLVTLRRWTAALYLFASVVKAFVEPHHVVDLTRVPVWRRQGSWQKHFSRVENSPWPQNHVLTMLMREMEMEPREFCAYTMPVVYASIMSDSVVMPASMRMRIASLIT